VRTAVTIVPADEERFEDLLTVFGTRGPASRCYCQRYKLRPREAFAKFPAEERASRLREQTCSGEGTTGLIAYLAGEPVGWCAVEPRTAYEGLVRNNRVPWESREENKADGSVWAVTCLFVRAGFRRQGISYALARAAVEFARARRSRARGLSDDRKERASRGAPRRHRRRVRRRRLHRGQPPHDPPRRDADRLPSLTSER
jgi:GNAT superfamily N-acetyltransferase